jgi:beta-phosphoglucomutase family hydrolase
MKAVIFDMDGVLVDTNPHHKTAWREYYQRFNKELSDDDFVRYVSGKHNAAIVAHLFDNQSLSEANVKQLSDGKEALFRKLYEHHMAPVSGLIDFLKALKAAGIRLAVATSAPVENLDFVVDTLNIRSYFDVLLNESLVKHPKPDPEIYELAMEKLGVSPDESIIFEDSTTGIQAAKASGAYVIGVTTTQSEDELIPFVDETINDFTDMTTERLQRLINVF